MYQIHWNTFGCTSFLIIIIIIIIIIIYLPLSRSYTSYLIKDSNGNSRVSVISRISVLTCLNNILFTVSLSVLLKKIMRVLGVWIFFAQMQLLCKS